MIEAVKDLQEALGTVRDRANELGDLARVADDASGSTWEMLYAIAGMAAELQLMLDVFGGQLDKDVQSERGEAVVRYAKRIEEGIYDEILTIEARHSLRTRGATPPDVDQAADPGTSGGVGDSTRGV